MRSAHLRRTMDRTKPGEGIAGEPVEDVYLERLISGERMNLQSFEIEPGATVPEHSHPHEQVGYVFEGTLTFLVDGEEIPIGPGDSFAIPGDEPHGARNDGDGTVRGVDVFSPPREAPDWGDD